VSASLRLTPLDYRKAQGTPPLSMAAHGPFILTIDGGSALGYCWQKQKPQDIDLFTVYSSIYRKSVVVYSSCQKVCWNCKQQSNEKAAFAAHNEDAVLWTVWETMRRVETPQLLPRCRWEKFAALANPISAGQMNGAVSTVPDNFD